MGINVRDNAVHFFFSLLEPVSEPVSNRRHCKSERSVGVSLLALCETTTCQGATSSAGRRASHALLAGAVRWSCATLTICSSLQLCCNCKINASTAAERRTLFYMVRACVMPWSKCHCLCSKATLTSAECSTQASSLWYADASVCLTSVVVQSLILQLHAQKVCFSITIIAKLHASFLLWLSVHVGALFSNCTRVGACTEPCGSWFYILCEQAERAAWAAHAQLPHAQSTRLHVIAVWLHSTHNTLQQAGLQQHVMSGQIRLLRVHQQAGEYLCDEQATQFALLVGPCS